MSNHNVKIKEFELPDDKDSVIAAIVAITRQDVGLLHQKNVKSLKMHLGKLKIFLKDQRWRRFENHDQSHEYTSVEALRMWKLIDRSVIKFIKSPLGPADFGGNLKFLIAELTKKVVFRSENAMPLSGISLSNYSVVSRSRVVAPAVKWSDDKKKLPISKTL